MVGILRRGMHKFVLITANLVRDIAHAVRRRYAAGTAERVGYAVPPRVLIQRQPHRLHLLHDRRGAEGGRHRLLRTALRSAKGPGNFRNLFVYAPNGKKDGIQLIPVSEVAAKGEFNSIKGITRDDMLAGLRIPPQLMGIVPQNAGGFGSIKEAAEVYAANELEPLQARLAQVNDWLGEEVIRFRQYELLNAKD